jgi:hypothetical protein
MTNEQLRMQFIGGIITESEYKVKLGENEDKDFIKSEMERLISKVSNNSEIQEEEKIQRINDIKFVIYDFLDPETRGGKRPPIGFKFDDRWWSSVKSLDPIVYQDALSELLSAARGSDSFDMDEKQDLNENIVSIGAINNPFPTRKKSDYELAFEYFTKDGLNEEDSMGKVGKQYAAPGQEKEVKGKKKEIKRELERQNANEFFKKTVSEIYNDASQGLIFVSPNPKSPERKSVFVDEKGKYKYLLTGEKNYGVGEVPYTNSTILPKSEAVSSPNKLDSFNFHIILRAVLQSEVQGPFKLPSNGRYQVSYAPDGTYRGIENIGNLIKVGWAGYVVELSKFSRVNPDFGFPQKLGGDLAWVSYRFRD